AGFSETDQRFAEQAAQSGLSEVQISRLAVGRTRNDDVKKLAQMMIDDHTKANDELKQIAERKGVKLPDECNDIQKATLERLGKMKGVNFDRWYARTMLGDHETAVSLFRTSGVKCSDA